MRALLACLLAAACVYSAAAAQSPTPDSATPLQVTVEVWADDGARLFLDDQKLIDDWRHCSATSARSHRVVNVTLGPGYHRLVVEYFQGESLPQDDPDPAKLYWSIPSLNIGRTIIPAGYFFHTDDDEQDFVPSQGLSAADLARFGSGLTSAASGGSEAQAVVKPGLVAHYFRDPFEWGGNWKPRIAPKVEARDWTFQEYAYTRTEPLINHVFITRGWFSIRWVGYLKVSPEPGESPPPVVVLPPDAPVVPPSPPSSDVPETPTGSDGPDPPPPVAENNPPPSSGPRPPVVRPGPTVPAAPNGGPVPRRPKGNNGVGNGPDPQPPGNPRPNDLPGTGPGNPGNRPRRPARVGIPPALPGPNGPSIKPPAGGANTPTGNVPRRPKGNNGVGNGVDPQPPGNPKPNDLPGTSPGNPGNKQPNGNGGGQNPKGNNGVGNGVDPQPPGDPKPNDQAGTSPGNPGNKQPTDNGNGQGSKGNNGVGNGVDPQPPGDPKPNDQAGTSPGNPGNKQANGRGRKR